MNLSLPVVEAFRLERYDNKIVTYLSLFCDGVVEAFRLERYDNSMVLLGLPLFEGCRSLSFGEV